MMKRRLARALNHRIARWLVLFGVLGLCALVAAEAAARPGGGSSYSGGSRSSSRSSGSSSSGGGSGSGGGGMLELVFELVMLCVRHPAIGIPLVLVLIVVFYYSQRGNQHDWSSTGARFAADLDPSMSPRATPRRADAEPARARLEALRNTDENFSIALFEDFLYSLYAEVQRRRGELRLPTLSAYLAPTIITKVMAETTGPIADVVIGAMRFLQVNVDTSNNQVELVVEFEVNYTEGRPGATQAWYQRDQWKLRRAANARSRAPEQARVFNCPNCSAPQDAVIQGKCRYCAKEVATGEFDWLLVAAYSMDREARPPMLTHTMEEQGTANATLVSAQANLRFAALIARDPAVSWGALQQRTNCIFHEFQVAWTAQSLQKLRAILSDNLFDLQKNWIAAYTREGLRNVLTAPSLDKMELVAVVSDKFYDAVSIRLYASSIDYTVRGDTELVAGNRQARRAYSEYWTLLRGAARRGKPRADMSCPNCGAPLVVDMVGQCSHCHAKVTAGEFDWVLSRIEQDESYSG
jgi:Tim44-like domain